MFEHVQGLVKNWALTTSERQKLQHAYIVLIVAVTFTAGAVAFFDAAKAHDVMRVVLVMVIAFSANAIVWHLMNSALLGRITPPQTPTRNKK